MHNSTVPKSKLLQLRSAKLTFNPKKITSRTQSNQEQKSFQSSTHLLSDKIYQTLIKKCSNIRYQGATSHEGLLQTLAHRRAKAVLIQNIMYKYLLFLQHCSIYCFLYKSLLKEIYDIHIHITCINIRYYGGKILTDYYHSQAVTTHCLKCRMHWLLVSFSLPDCASLLIVPSHK